MTKPHLKLSPDPVPEGQDTPVLCGLIVPKAAFPFMWQESDLFSDLISGTLAPLICRHCRRVLADGLDVLESSDKRFYVYGVTSGEEAKQTEAA